MNRFRAFLALALLCLTASLAPAEQFGDFTYVVNDDETITITGYSRDALGFVEIPAEIAAKPVTAIGDFAFFRRERITSVSLPEGVTGIGTGAFFGCHGLTSISIPEGVTGIGQNAFDGCVGLASIFIPKSVSWIGSNAFIACHELTWVTIASGVVIGDYAFADCTKLDCMVFLGDSPRFAPCVFEGIRPPRIEVVGEPPAPRIDDGSLSIRFDPSHRGFGYRVETSRDLVHWTTEGVFLSGILPDGEVLASVPIDGPARFLRLAPYITNWIDRESCGGLG